MDAEVKVAYDEQTSAKSHRQEMLTSVEEVLVVSGHLVVLVSLSRDS